MLKTQLEKDLKQVIEDLGYKVSDIFCYIPKNSSFGEYSTNIPLQLAKQETSKGYQTPVDIANEIKKKLEELVQNEKKYLEKVEVAGPGFVNFYFTSDALMKNVLGFCDYASFVNPGEQIEEIKKENPQKVLVEYASFNALKPVHVGHLRNITLGESITRLMEAVGQEVNRVTYTSDIGLPSAKVVWGLLKYKDEVKESRKKSLRERVEFLGSIYVKANTAYEDDEESKKQVDEINTKIYQREKQVVSVWQEALSWTFEYFETIYKLVGTRFDKQFLESEVAEPGLQIVRDNIGKVFREDAGAVIFPGEEFGLHNRVFVSSAGNPTYEAKDMGLARLEDSAFNSDLILHIVANDQSDYFKVIFKALDLLDHDLANKERHLSYGYVTLPSGKMSSRKGNVVTLEYLYDEIRKRIDKIMSSSVKTSMTSEEKDEVSRIISIGAMKFALLKYSSNTDITFDIDKSVSLEGDSGPYLQYTYARAKSVLRAASFNYQLDLSNQDKLEVEERQLLQKIEHFPSIVSEAANSLNPTIVASFLIECAKLFNTFYQKHPILKADEEKMHLRLALTCSVAVLLKKGLYLLGIDAPERM